MTDLEKLAERCEQATGVDRELDTIILATVDGYTTIEERKGGWIVATGKGTMERSLGLIDPGQHSRNFTPQHHDTPAFTASLDAAMTLVGTYDRIEFGGWSFGKAGTWATISINTAEFEGAGATRELALCAAALRARTASVDRSPQGQDAEERLDAKHESAVPLAADAQKEAHQ